MVDERFEYTKQKLSENVSIRQIARDLRVDCATVSYWIKTEFTSKPRNSSVTKDDVIEQCQKYSPQYSYILGSYLGDGFIKTYARTKKLVIYNDIKYSEIIKDQIEALKILFPNNIVNQYKQLSTNCVEVGVHNKHLSKYFPQHGVGKKHNRDVSLKDWQYNIVLQEPECFIMGLIDSDGCEYMHTTKVAGKCYDYRYYQFTNKSTDILNIYIKVMDQLKITTNLVKKSDGICNVFTRNANEVSKIDALYVIAEDKLRT